MNKKDIKKLYSDPNKEVEKWKDAEYKEIKHLHDKALAEYYTCSSKEVFRGF